MSRRPWLRFMLLFALALAVLGFAISTPWTVKHLREPLCVGLAHATGALVNGLGIEARVEGSQVIAREGAVQIVPDCDGISLLAVFLAAVLAFPGRRSPRVLPGIVAALGALVALNLVRLVVLTVVVLRASEHFEMAHLQVGQGVMVLTTVLLFAAWASRERNLVLEAVA